MHAARVLPAVLLLVAAAVAGCGGPSEGGATMATRPTSAATGPGPVPIRRGTAPAPVTLSTGEQLLLASEPSARQPWSAPASSDEGVLTCRSTTHPDGSVTATCRAVAPGTAFVTTVTAPFAGDPQGPAQFRWQLTVAVRPG